MNLLSVSLLALAMSTDAFAAAVGKGSALQKPRWSEALRTGVIFGAIETVTPIIGWLLGSATAQYVTAWDHWIAFVLLGCLGVRMIMASLDSSDTDDTPKPNRHSLRLLALTGFATSIDAMAVGVGLAIVNVDVLPIAVAIGVTTLVMVTLGTMLGRFLGSIAGKRAEIVGGILLIVIGSIILHSHLTAATLTIISCIVTKYLITKTLLIFVSEVAKRSNKPGGFSAALSRVSLLMLVRFYVEVREKSNAT